MNQSKSYVDGVIGNAIIVTFDPSFEGFDKTMKVYRSLQEFVKTPYPVVTMGTFDGVHRGHRMIIDRMRRIASEHGGQTVLLTFFPHPRMVLNTAFDLKLIDTMEEKIAALEYAGIDNLVVHPFNMEFAALSSTDFVKKILVNTLGVKHLVIGHDHHFGKNREGTYGDLLKLAPQCGFEIEQIQPQFVDDEEVSSTLVRKAIARGDMEYVARALTRPYSLSGHVVQGRRLGRSLGYPTANMQIDEAYKLLPAEGAYAVRVIHGNTVWKGMMNIGRNPTVGNHEVSVEVNIFDIDSDLYGDRLTLQVVGRLREERKFESLDALKLQLALDKESALNVLS